mgnify:CR=1 FL=1
MCPRILSAAAARGLRAHLRRGGLVAYPTESSYGLGCLPTHRRALRRLMRLKKRPQHKGLIVIGNDLKQLEPLLQRLPENQRRLAQSTWPAAVTFLFAAADSVPSLLRGRGREKLAALVRAVGHAAGVHFVQPQREAGFAASARGAALFRAGCVCGQRPLRRLEAAEPDCGCAERSVFALEAT